MGETELVITLNSFKLSELEHIETLSKPCSVCKEGLFCIFRGVFCSFETILRAAESPKITLKFLPPGFLTQRRIRMEIYDIIWKHFFFLKALYAIRFFLNIKIWHFRKDLAIFTIDNFKLIPKFAFSYKNRVKKMLILYHTLFG